MRKNFFLIALVGFAILCQVSIGQDRFAKRSKLKLDENCLLNNGKLANSFGTGPNGSDVSLMPEVLSEVGYFTHNPNLNGIEYRLSDDFYVSAPKWKIDSIEFFGFTSSADTNQIFDYYSIQIWDGEPGDPNSDLIWGNEITNCYNNSKFSGVYRSNGSFYVPIISNICLTPDLILSEGNYWVDWNGRPVPNSNSAYAPPIVYADEVKTGNARSAASHEWIDIVDMDFPQGLPFKIYGTAIKDELDVAINSIAAPKSDYSIGAAENFQVSIKNNGTENINEVTAKFYVNDVLLATETMSETIVPGGYYTYNSNHQAVLEVDATSIIKVELSLSGETFTRNNAIQKSIDKYSKEVLMVEDTDTLDFANFFDDGGPNANHSQNKSYLLTVYPSSTNKDARLSVEFMDFDLYYAAAYLKVYNGTENDYNQQIASFSTGYLPDEYRRLISTDTSGALTFEFHSSNHMTRPGWKARFKTITTNNHDLAVTSINIPDKISSNKDFPCEVTVKNIGETASTEYKIRVYDDYNNLLSELSASSLYPDQTNTFTSVLNLDSNNIRRLHVFLQYEDDDLTNNTIDPVKLTYGDSTLNMVSVGEPKGLFNYPTDIGRNTSLNEMLFYPDEIPAGITITDIGFKTNFGHNMYDLPIKIWLGETDQDLLTDAYIPPSELTLVYDGSIQITKGINDKVFELQTPYNYTGRNLVMLVFRPFKDWSTGFNKFYCVEKPEQVGRSLGHGYLSSYFNIEDPRYIFPSGIVPYTEFYFDNSAVSSVKGIVTNTDGDILNKAIITVDGGKHEISTGSNGLFWAQDINEGEHIIQTNCLHYEEKVDTIQVVNGEVYNYSPVLTPAPKVYLSTMVRKFEAPTEGLEGVKFNVSSSDTSFEAYTDNTGLLLVPNVPSAVTYEILATKDGYQDHEILFYADPSNSAIPSFSMRENTIPVSYVNANLYDTTLVVTWPPATSFYEIAYDDGNVFYGMNRYMNAVRFTPDDYPCKLDGSRMYMYYNTILSPDTVPPFELIVYDDNGVDNLPGTVLWSDTVQPDDYGWFLFDLPEAINISEGDFYIAATAVTDEYIYFGYDNEPSTNSYIIYHEGGNWQPYSNYSYGKNIMIRAIVDGPHGDKELLSQAPNDALEGYNIYRLLKENEDDESTWELLYENLLANYCIDSAWVPLNSGVYEYAVKSYYAFGNLSKARISNPVDKDMFIEELAIKVLPFENQIIEDLAFDIISDKQKFDSVYSGIFDENGVTVINDVRKGDYSIYIKDKRFVPTVNNVTIDSDDTLEIELMSQPHTPLYASAAIDSDNSVVDWTDPSAYSIASYDDGTADGSISSGQSNPVWLGNKFLDQAGTIKAIEFYAEKDPFTINEPLTIDIFDENRNLIHTSEPFEIEPFSWNYIPIEDVAVDGAFYAMIHFNSPSISQHPIGVDTDGPEVSLDLAYKYNGSDWETINEYYSNLYDETVFLLRALMQPETGSTSNVNIDTEFDVFRIRKGNEGNNELWDTIATDLTTNTIEDNEWEDLPWGEYTYAVRSTASFNQESEFAFTNYLPKDIQLEVEVNITTNASYVPEGILVDLTNIENNDSVYSQLSDDEGVAQFDGIFRGLYHIRASHRNFEVFSDTIDLTENGFVEIALIEKALPVGGVVAEQQNKDALVSWSDPNSITVLSHDDGTCENGFTPYAYDNLWLGNVFQLSSDVTIESVDIYSMENSNAYDGELVIDFFNDSLECIGSSEPFHFEAENWVNVIVPSMPYDGNFLFAMVHWYNVPGETHYLGLDQNGPNATNPYSVSYNGVAWGTTQQYFDGVFMLRTNVLSDGKLTQLGMPELPIQLNSALSGFEGKEFSPLASNSNGFMHPLPSNKTKETNCVYNVYRLLEGEEANTSSWTTISEDLADKSIVDEAWENLPYDSYKYAIEAKYTSGVVSSIVFSNTLVKDSVADLKVTVNPTNSSSASGFKVKIETTDQSFIDSLITGGTGVALFNDIAKDTYNITVSKEGYYDANETNYEVIESLHEITIDIDPDGISEIQTSDIKIYPVPARDYLVIETELDIQSVLITDMLGCIVYEENNLVSSKLNISELQTGSYCIVLKTNNQKITKLLQVIK